MSIKDFVSSYIGKYHVSYYIRFNDPELDNRHKYEYLGISFDELIKICNFNEENGFYLVLSKFSFSFNCIDGCILTIWTEVQ